jgi:putative ABC transport system permease protein
MIRLSGRFRSSLIIGVQGIRARKLRTFLSMISLFLGVLAVVTVQAGAEIGQRALLSNVELNSGIDGTIQMYLETNEDTAAVVFDTLHGRTDAVALTSTQAIIGEPGVTPINPGGSPFDRLGSQGGYGPPSGGYVTCDPSGRCTMVQIDDPTAQPPGQAIELRLNAMTGDIRQFKPFRPQSGRWLDFSTAPSLSPGLVLNLEAAKGFARYRVPAEMRMQGAIANPTPRIIGVIDDGMQQPTAYVRADEFLNWLPSPAAATQFGGLQIMMSPAATETDQILRARLAGVGVGPQRIHAEPVRARESVLSSLALVRLIFLGLAGLVLLIGVAGILNVGLATVGERIEEFALRRAVGTPRLLLAGIVLAETLLTGLFTAAAAIGVGVLALRFAAPLISGRETLLQNLDFPWQAGVAGVIAGLIAGLLGGLIPAIRAARIPIATVMRA